MRRSAALVGGVRRRWRDRAARDAASRRSGPSCSARATLGASGWVAAGGAAARLRRCSPRSRRARRGDARAEADAVIVRLIGGRRDRLGAGLRRVHAAAAGPRAATYAPTRSWCRPAAPGRIDRGLRCSRRQRAKRMLVTGVAPGVTQGRPRARLSAMPAAFACCVDLGAEAVDTRVERRGDRALGASAHGYRSVRLVTSDWHMARARDGAARGARRRRDDRAATACRASRGSAPLVNEYNKLLLRRVALWTGMRLMIGWLRTIGCSARVFYAGSVPIVRRCRSSALFGQRAVIAHAHVWARFHRWCVRDAARHPAARRGAVPAGPGALRRQAPGDVRDAGAAADPATARRWCSSTS